MLDAAQLRLGHRNTTEIYADLKNREGILLTKRFLRHDKRVTPRREGE